MLARHLIHTLIHTHTYSTLDSSWFLLKTVKVGLINAPPGSRNLFLNSLQMNNSRQATGRSGLAAGLADGQVAAQAGAVVLPRAEIAVGSGLR